MNYKQLSNKNLCVSIANKNFNQCFEIAKNSDLVELRLDLLELNFNELTELFKLDTKFIITHRLGEFLNEQASSFLKNIIDLGADYIDIEIEKGNQYVDDLINYSENTNCKIILSYHNYEYTPNTKDLQAIIDTAKQQKAYYVKIASHVTTQTDVARILSLYENNDKLIAFGMGEIGRISRVASLYLGADFTYVSTGKNNETAAGQITKDEMHNIFEII